MDKEKTTFSATTILGVRQKGEIALGGDGQVTMGETIMKVNARKVRKMYNDTILTGFAGNLTYVTKIDTPAGADSHAGRL